MTEVLFYHLQNAPLEQVLPQLLERSLERGWRAIVRAGGPERLDALNNVLWTYSDDSFLPHGTKDDGPAALEPVFLTVDDENPNNAYVLFLVDGAAPGNIGPYERCVLMFDGRDEAALAAAREHWKTLKAEGHDATYWQQDERGKWEKKA
ncbi:DNA polymerase III subunit chi [Parvibaculum sp.]|uniref:DNA polymerase III subunit chi n=1 Tax=Parvibaculum sp. TaxID=2024848 RepID=UPI0027303AE0|nr:DNA polymerase III subunit chi [Parvibaculum sp.]MDP1627812.1 DNA polymerase III subunit chi [Parvibaculum sp.]MDP2150810.1 DNA polymerase III subunit chi [Parvibaculum sp.]MDP3327645.1 DNA polymerase III subunit chi [Parvibaculum sp.]